MFTPEQICKMPRRNIKAEDFIKLAEIKDKRFIDSVKSCYNGDFLAVWFNKKNSRWYRLHLKSMWFKPFTLKYSCHKDIRQGKELLISNLELPKGSVMIK